MNCRERVASACRRRNRSEREKKERTAPARLANATCVSEPVSPPNRVRRHDSVGPAMISSIVRVCWTASFHSASNVSAVVTVTRPNRTASVTRLARPGRRAKSPEMQ